MKFETAKSLLPVFYPLVGCIFKNYATPITDIVITFSDKFLVSEHLEDFKKGQFFPNIYKDGGEFTLGLFNGDNILCLKSLIESNEVVGLKESCKVSDLNEKAKLLDYIQ